MEDPGIAFGQILFQSVQAGRLEEDQDATAESATHHARPDDVGNLGGELNEKIKLPAAYREIVSKTRMRRIQNAAEPSGRPSLQHGSGLEDARGADVVFAELYTSTLAGASLESVERLVGKKIRLALDPERGRKILCAPPAGEIGRADAAYGRGLDGERYARGGIAPRLRRYEPPRSRRFARCILGKEACHRAAVDRRASCARSAGACR